MSRPLPRPGLLIRAIHIHSRLHSYALAVILSAMTAKQTKLNIRTAEIKFFREVGKYSGINRMVCNFFYRDTISISAVSGMGGARERDAKKTSALNTGAAPKKRCLLLVEYMTTRKSISVLDPKPLNYNTGGIVPIDFLCCYSVHSYTQMFGVRKFSSNLIIH